MSVNSHRRLVREAKEQQRDLRAVADATAEYATAVAAHDQARLARRAAIEAGRYGDAERAAWATACAALEAAFDRARAAGAELLDQSVKSLNPYR